MDGKSCTAGIDKTEPWPRPSNFASRSIYLRQVSGQDGQGSLFVSSKTGSIGVRLCLETFHYQSLKNGSEERGKSLSLCQSLSKRHRRFHRFELTKVESICLQKQQRCLPRLLDSIIFHTIPWVCVLSWNASSGLPEEHLLFDSHDVSMHLGGLHPLMRDHEQINVRSLTTRFKANTLRLPHLHIPRRSMYQEGAVAAWNAG